MQNVRSSVVDMTVCAYHSHIRSTGILEVTTYMCLGLSAYLHAALEHVLMLPSHLLCLAYVLRPMCGHTLIWP